MKVSKATERKILASAGTTLHPSVREELRSIDLWLPFPPTVNTYWRSVVLKGRLRVLISSKGREYRKAVEALHRGGPVSGRLLVQIVAYPPDRRRRDLDNLCKAILDSLCHAGAYADDCQIDRLTVERSYVRAPDGRVHVTIARVDQGERFDEC